MTLSPPVRETALRLRPGETLLGRITVGDVIGHGASGQVFRGVDRQRGDIAIKTLRSVDEQRIVDLKSEFRVLANLVHPNLVRLHELACDGGHWFITMDRVPGMRFSHFVRGTDHGFATDDEPTLTTMSSLCSRADVSSTNGSLSRHSKTWQPNSPSIF